MTQPINTFPNSTYLYNDSEFAFFFSFLRFLYEKGCNVHLSNSFGCNAILWAAQGNNSKNHETIQWLTSIGCNINQINTNGHGILHKSAQRGNIETCQWFFQTFYSNHLLNINEKESSTMSHYDDTNVLLMIGPDKENCCPSDLAGMEGHGEVATWLAERECQIAHYYHHHQLENQPKWLRDSIKETVSCMYHGDLNVWEQGGGIRRMASFIVNKFKK